MIWGYAGAASLDEAGLHPLRRRPPGLSRALRRGVTRILPAARRSASGRRPSSTSASSGIRRARRDRRDVARREQLERGRDVGVADVGDRREDVDLAQDHRREVELARRAVQADEQHAPAAARAGDRRGRRVRARRWPRSRRRSRRRRVSSSSSSARSRPVAFAVSLAPSADAVASRSASMSIATTRPPTARRDGARDDERADPAGADHRDGVVRALRDPGERVERDGERLRHRGRVVVARRRERDGRSPPATSRTRRGRRRPAGRACGTRRTGSCGRARHQRQ